MDTKAKKVYEYLQSEFPEAKCELGHVDTYQLLVAVILSAQCTDKRVNIVTKELFKKYPTVNEMAAAKLEELEEEIRTCGLYRNKAKNIISACRDIVSKHGGKVPGDFNDLVALSGVGRKTANVVMAVGFGKDAIAVDTHVFRVSNRPGLADSENVLEVEKQLQKELPKKEWSLTHHLLIFHGRRCCIARKPKCEECPLAHLCKYRKEMALKK